MIIGPLDLGAPSHPWMAPVTGLTTGTILLEGTDTIVWSRGSVLRTQTVSFRIKAWQALGGQSAGSSGAAKYLVRQLEEFASNPRLQPVFIQWGATFDPAALLNAVELHDGWYIITSFEPDYRQNIVTALVQCRMSVALVAPGLPRRLAIAYQGGLIPTNFSGVGKNIVSAPISITPIDPTGSFNRSGAEGQIGTAQTPLVNPLPLSAPWSSLPENANVSNLLRGGVHVYDTISTAANPVPTGPGTGANLLSQAGLESPNSDWILGGVGTGLATIDGTNPRTGSLALKMTNPSAGNYGTAFNKRGLNMAGVSVLNLSVYMKTTGSAGVCGPFRVTFANPGSFIDSNGIASFQPSAQAGTVSYDISPSITTSYGLYSFNILVPPGYQWAFVEAYSNGNGTPNPMFYDDFVLQDAARNSNWVEVFGTDHDFIGDCIVSNGLALWSLRQGAGSSGYVWNIALVTPAWQQWSAGLHYIDSAGNVSANDPDDYTLLRVDADEVALTMSSHTAPGRDALFTLRLQRGRYELRVDYKCINDTGSQVQGPIIYFNSMTAKIVYTSASVRDNVSPPGESSPPTATDYGYGAVISATAGTPVIAGFLYVNQSSGSMPQIFGAGNGDASSGDGGFALGQVRSYAVFAIPYGVAGSYLASDLQGEGENGSKGGSWVTVADAGQSAGNVAKLPAGSNVSHNDNINGGHVFAPGLYRVWFRVKVTSAASSQVDMSLGLWDSTAAAAALTVSYRPNQVTTSYAWISPGTVTVIAAHTYFLFSTSVPVSLATDWFVDEAAMVPLALSDDARGPQDLWQQFIYDRGVRLIRP